MNYKLPEQMSAYLSLVDERLQGYLSTAIAHAQAGLVAAWDHLPEIAPYLPVIVTAAAALVCLMLFLGVRVQLKSIQARLRAFEEKADEVIGNAIAAPEGTEKATPAPEEERLILTVVPKSGLDTTIRSKVLRMHRSGKSPDDIAASLRMPKGEVDLLVKVHEIELGSLEEPAPA